MASPSDSEARARGKKRAASPSPADDDGRQPSSKKRKIYQERYLKDWESDPALSGWLTTSKRSPGKAFCLVCNKDLDFRSGGVYDLKRHATRESHIKASRVRETHGSVSTAFRRLQDDGVSVAAANGVLKLAFFLAEHHIALSAADHLVKLIASVCPDSKIAAEMKGARTKMTAAVTTIARDMHNDLVDIVSNGFFSIIPDESCDIAIKEQVAVAVRVFDERCGKVKTLSYGVRNIADASAAGIFAAIEGMVTDDDVPWSETLLGLSTDGANVMRGRHNSVLTRMRGVQPNVYSLHCTCHAVHLCAEAACKAFLPSGFEEWLRKMAYFFDRSAKRTAAFKQVQRESGRAEHKLVKPASTRWLSLQDTAVRTLEEWNSLLEYFTSNDDVKDLDNVRQWVESMKQPETKGYLSFLAEVLPLVTRFNKKFQGGEVLIHTLYEEQLELHRLLLLNCVKPAAVRAAKTAQEQIRVDVYSARNQLPEVEIVLCEAARQAIAVLPKDRQAKFFRRCRDVYATAVIQVRQRLPLQDPVLAGVRILCPTAGPDRSATEVAMLARHFPNVTKPEDIVPLQREWHSYQSSSLQKMPKEVDQYWHAVSLLKDDDQPRFPCLSRLAKALLVLPHSSADVERHFSVMTVDKTNLRNRMEADLLDSLMTISCKKGDVTCLSFTPTAQMRADLPKQVARAAGRAQLPKKEGGSTARKGDGSSGKGSGSGMAGEKSQSCSKQGESSCKVNSKASTGKQRENSGSSKDQPVDHTKESSHVGQDCAGKQGAQDGKRSATQYPDLTPVTKTWRLGQVTAHYLPASVSQGVIDGRKTGSSACTVIACSVVRSLLAGEFPLPGFKESPPSRQCFTKLVDCIRDGNGVYDAAGL